MKNVALSAVCRRDSRQSAELKPTYVDATPLRWVRPKRQLPPGFIVPCQPTLANKVPARSSTDGFRIAALKDGDTVRSQSYGLFKLVAAERDVDAGSTGPRLRPNSGALHRENQHSQGESGGNGDQVVASR